MGGRRERNDDFLVFVTTPTLKCPLARGLKKPMKEMRSKDENRRPGGDQFLSGLETF